MIGYDKIPEHASHTQEEGALFEDNRLEHNLKKVRERLLARGFSESINLAFLNREFHEYFIDKKAKPISILNPLSERYGIMRMTLLPGLLKNLIHNQRNQEKSIQLFEVGTVFLGVKESSGKPEPKSLTGTLDQDSFAIEKQYLAGVMSGFLPTDAFDSKSSTYDFFSLKGVISECLTAVGLSLEGPSANVIFHHGSRSPYLHPGESAEIVINGTTVGHMGKLHPDIAEACGVEGQVFLFELDQSLWSGLKTEVPKYKNFSRFPGITRDVAVLADESVKIGDISALAYDVPEARSYLSEVKIFDIYRGKNIPEGKKSVAISHIAKK